MVQLAVEFESAFAGAELGPGERRQARVDDGGVQAVERVLETEAVLWRQVATAAEQRVKKLLINSGRLYVEALKQGVDQAGEVVVIGDGAAWIWNQAELTLPKNRVEIIDYYHASEKLWTVAKAIWGEDDAHGKKWAEHWSDKLYKGRFERVLGALRRLRAQTAAARESIRQTTGYFKVNHKRMRYGYFIGSGVTESSCKHLVGTRLKRAGMHWDKQQAQAILQLRLARLNGRWDHLWN